VSLNEVSSLDELLLGALQKHDGERDKVIFCFRYDTQQRTGVVDSRFNGSSYLGQVCRA
jgi:hypothetical protein